MPTVNGINKKMLIVKSMTDGAFRIACGGGLGIDDCLMDLAAAVPELVEFRGGTKSGRYFLKDYM